MIEKKIEIHIAEEKNKEEVIQAIEMWRSELGFDAVEINTIKPWGAYWKINGDQVGKFIELFFPQLTKEEFNAEQNLSPKFLLVAPHHRLSWQYHNRRAEEWMVIAGSVLVEKSQNDLEPEKGDVYQCGERVGFCAGERHRMAGSDGWGLVAEIWIHSDPESPSDEDDIVRIQDDYGRESNLA